MKVITHSPTYSLIHLTTYSLTHSDDEQEVEQESVIDPNINEISTYFDGDVNTYLSEFAKDVTRFIDTMPSLDSNVILGVPPTSLTPAAAHEVVTMAVKLDPSTRTPMPSSACIWIGTQLMKTDEAITTLVPSYPDTPLPPPPPAKPTNLSIDFKNDNR